MRAETVQAVLHCLIYMAVTGVAAFLIGRIAPKRWFHFDRFPYRSFAFEREGNLYNALGVRHWKDHLPDMSRIVRHLIPSKRLPKQLTADHLEQMLQETCVAECIHVLLCLTGIRLFSLWQGFGGVMMYVIYLFGNIPFCIIQRHNRPKLARIYRKLQAEASAGVKEAIS